ncbi:BMC domain-containing protein [Clostridium sardiniense]|uniref:BMC domain-containing protein n=1 Tax=Clostridium sardiniense TaxID=29369 RepID=UPI003D32C7CC
MNKSIGSIEFRSISKGIEIANEMVKRADVDVIYAKSICPGKFIIMISGDASEVHESVNYGLKFDKKYIVDSFILNRVHDDIVNGLKSKYKSKEIEGLAIGIMETNKVCAGLEALDKALKSGDVNLVKLQLAFAIGGKLVYILSGTLSSVEHSINTAIEEIEAKDIVATSIIPSPEVEFIRHII